MADDIDGKIEESALGPESASADGVSTKQHNLKDQIAADKYLLAKTEGHADPRQAFTRVKIVPPGSV